MRIECPKCGYCGDEDDFEEPDELEDAVEDAREEAKIIQAHLMAGRLLLGEARLGDLLAQLEIELQNSRLPAWQHGSPRPDDRIFYLREADWALHCGRTGDAIYQIEKFLHPAPAATVRSEGEMRTFLNKQPRTSGSERNTASVPAGGAAGG